MAGDDYRLVCSLAYLLKQAATGAGLAALQP